MTDIIDQLVNEINRLSKICALLEDACAIYRQASIQAHSSHFDRTGQHGLGCEECIRADTLRDKADFILKQIEE